VQLADVAAAALVVKPTTPPTSLSAWPFQPVALMALLLVAAAQLPLAVLLLPVLLAVELPQLAASLLLKVKAMVAVVQALQLHLSHLLKALLDPWSTLLLILLELARLPMLSRMSTFRPLSSTLTEW
jgi:hypothetical protein